MKDPIKSFLYLLLLLFALSCGDDPVVTPEPEPKPEPELPVTEEPVVFRDGFSWSPEIPDADKELTIWFKASPDSDPENGLFDYTGDVYLYSGIIWDGEWRNQPSAWTDNNPKYKMSRIDRNVWSITLGPTVRNWYGAATSEVTNLGIIVRSADGKRKGYQSDYFLNVTGFEPVTAKSNPMPGNVKQGINIINSTTVTLVLFDKDNQGKRNDFAYVIGDFNNWTLSNDEKSQMSYDTASGCWWITLTNLSPLIEYSFQYYIGKKGSDAVYVADPYARKVLDPDNDKQILAVTYPENMTYPERAIGMVSVFKINDAPYNWQIPDFQVPSRDNLVIYELLLRDFTESGDINGVMTKLDYLQSLGVNAIELMPVQEFDGNDSWGYNPAFFFAMDKAYGTDRMYKEFIDECHKRGMAVILDVVYNHATGANSFARMWWNSWTNKTSANNPFFNVIAPHPFSVFHDFNHSNPLVRDFVKRNLEFLLDEYHVDGFRFDLSKGFTQKQSTDDGVFRVYDPNRISYLKEYNSTIKAKRANALVILEHFADDREETELSNNGMMVWRNNNDLYKRSAIGYYTNFSGVYYGSANRPVNSLVSYMESHDEERTAYIQLSEGSTYIKNNLGVRMSLLSANAAFFFTIPGPKMVWQFGELGYDISINENGRTGRKPVKWDYLQVPERKELHNTYSSLINLRMEHKELFNATSTLNWKEGRYFTLSSFGNVKHLVVIGNFTTTTTSGEVTFPDKGVWYNYLEPGTTIYVPTTSMNVELPPYSFKIYTNFEP
jgi:1,4-alpha-glucan branching enzyme